MKLSELKTGQAATITSISGEGAFRRRLAEMGFVRGQRVIVVKNAPLSDPIEYNIMGYEVSLRRSEAAKLGVENPYLIDDLDLETQPPQEHLSNHEISQPHAVPATGTLGNTPKSIINVALVGNPNSGKTTLFNSISGLDEHTGNYSGVTVGAKQATVDFEGHTIIITDLPGTYSISPFSPEERFVREHLAVHKPDVVVNVVDGSNLERNLYLTTQLLDMEQSTILALNMYDEFLASGDKLDKKVLSELLGMPIIPTVGKRGRGVAHILQAVVRIADMPLNTERPKINYPQEVEELIDNISKRLTATQYTFRYTALKLIEGQSDIALPEDRLKHEASVAKAVKNIELIYSQDIETITTDSRYAYISGALKECYTQANHSYHTRSTRIDRVLTHRWLGLPIFGLLLWLIFYATFTLGQYPMEWIEMGVDLIKESVNSFMSEGAFKDLIVSGIIDGLGSVIVFLPNIVILFLFISFMEDTGYMARAAFITDKLMHRIGLHGKSFIPLIMGFGCGVPAVMATRTIENRQNRLQTMLLVPFMSCSARLPVYILIAGTFFADNAANVLFAMYLGGIIIAIGSSLMLKKLAFSGRDVTFVMELPPYRIPTLRSTLKHVWNKAAQYLSKMGGVILIAVIIIWALGYYPHNEETVRAVSQTEINDAQTATLDNPSTERMLKLTDSQAATLDSAAQYAATARQESNSYLGRIGRTIEPIIAPLGFDWKMGIGLLSGIAAKEVVVSSMSVIYQSGNEDDNSALGSRLRAELYPSGQRVWNSAVAISFMTFVLIYFPCVAVVTAIHKEAGAWKWALFTVVYTTALAWVVSFIVYNIALKFL